MHSLGSTGASTAAAGSACCSPRRPQRGRVLRRRDCPISPIWTLRCAAFAGRRRWCLGQPIRGLRAGRALA